MGSVPELNGENVVHMQPPPRRMAIDWENLPIHPAAAAWPEMTEEQVEELAKDINEHGLQIPLVVFEDNSAVVDGSEGPFPQYLLDGRSRRRGLAKSGATPESAYRIIRAMQQVDANWVPDTDPYAFVLTVNSHRLHLNNEQKRAAILAAIAARPQASDRDIAKQTGTSPTTVGTTRSEGVQSGHIPNPPAAPTPNDLARDALIDDPERSNVEIAKLIGVSDKTVGKARKELEEENRILPRTRTSSAPRSKKSGDDVPPPPTKTAQELREEETARSNAEAAAWLKEHAANDIPAWITWLETMDNDEVINLLEQD